MGGLAESPMPGRLGRDTYVDVHRLEPAVTSFEPVRSRARHYLEDGARFSKAQLGLLALLSLARKLPLAPGAAYAVRRILDAAAARLNELLEGEREPMICSELVFRCFNEAKPGEDDEYALRIDARPGAPDSDPRGLRPAVPQESLFAASLEARRASGWRRSPRSRPVRRSVTSRPTTAGSERRSRTS